MTINHIEAVLAIYAVLGIATYILMWNYRGNMRTVSTKQETEMAPMSFMKFSRTALAGFVAITVFWPLMVVAMFTTLKK